MSMDQLVGFYGVGSGDAKLFPRRVQLVKPDTGWQGFVDTWIKPARDAGLRRFLLWMPFGQEVGENDGIRTQTVNGKSFPTRVRFDQYQQAERAGLTWLTTGFVEAIRPLVEDGCQVIAYCGTLGGAPEYENATTVGQRIYLAESLSVFLRAGCDLAFDSAVHSPPWHYVSTVADWLRQGGTRVYCEAMPYLTAPQWASGDVLSVEAQYQNATKSINASLFVNPRLITGELVRMMITPEAGKNWATLYREKVPPALADGHSVCIFAKSFMDQGGKFSELTGA